MQIAEAVDAPHLPVLSYGGPEKSSGSIFVIVTLIGFEMDAMSEAVGPIKRAVIADDDEFFRLALAAILTRHLGFTDVVETSSLDEALARLGDFAGDGSVSLALFDLEMPGMTGAASMSAVRDCFPDVRIAIVSASTRRRDILTALEAGAHGYVPKGSSAVQLTKALEMILAGFIYVPPSLAEVRPAGDQSLLVPEVGELRAATTDTNAKSANLVFEGLTPRQKEVLKLIVAGKANKEIARALELSEGTVKVHVAALLRTLGVANRAGAAAAGSRLIT